LTSFQGIGNSSCESQSSYCVSTIRPENLSSIRPGRTTVLPNPSLKLTRYGMRCKPGPRHMVHHRSPGLQRTPPRAA
jgi:hypothetical protein